MACFSHALMGVSPCIFLGLFLLICCKYDEGNDGEYRVTKGELDRTELPRARLWPISPPETTRGTVTSGLGEQISIQKKNHLFFRKPEGSTDG